jgi:hypothetical protein
MSIENLEALNGIDESFIVSAEKAEKSCGKRPVWKLVLPAAAALLLVIGAALGIKSMTKRGDKPPVSAAVTVEPTATAAPAAIETNAPDADNTQNAAEAFTVPDHSMGDSEDCLLPMLLFNDKIYTRFATCSQFSDFFGDYAGSVSSQQPAEWLPSGNVFTVNGYDTGFLVCQRGSNGEAEVYINDVGSVYSAGADLFESKFRLSETLASVMYLDYSEANEYGSPSVIDISSPGFKEAVDLFLEALNEGKWTRNSDYRRDDKTIILSLNNDLFITLRISVNGYVYPFPFEYAFEDCSVKADPEKLRPLLDIIDEKMGDHIGYEWSEDHVPEEILQSNERFGRYVPSELPDGYKYYLTTIHYNVDQSTGRILGTDLIEMIIDEKDYSSAAYVAILPKDGLDSRGGCQVFDIPGGRIVPLSEIAVPIEEFTEDDILYSSLIKWGSSDVTLYAVVIIDDAAISIRVEYYDNEIPDAGFILELLDSINN